MSRESVIAEAIQDLKEIKEWLKDPEVSQETKDFLREKKYWLELALS